MNRHGHVRGKDENPNAVVAGLFGHLEVANGMIGRVVILIIRRVDGVVNSADRHAIVVDEKKK
jgi:hypothetical protein